MRRRCSRSSGGLGQSVLLRAEEAAYQLPLQRRAVDAVHRLPERFTAGMAAAIPLDVLARDAQAGGFAVEGVERIEVFQQQLAHCVRRGLRQALAAGEEMCDLAEDPGPALRGAADHQAVDAGL